MFEKESGGLFSLFVLPCLETPRMMEPPKPRSKKGKREKKKKKKGHGGDEDGGGEGFFARPAVDTSFGEMPEVQCMWWIESH